jgi:hypothetical protein
MGFEKETENLFAGMAAVNKAVGVAAAYTPVDNFD